MSKAASNERGSLAEAIEADIYEGRFAPGMWLKQIDLEAHYKCTRLALRHALEQLQSRKVISHVHNRGYYVPTVDLDNLRQIWHARALVESSIADELIENVTPDSLARLSYLASQYSESVRTGTMLEQDRANQAFHAEMLAACPNQVMVELIWDLRKRVPLAVQRANNTPAEWEQSARDHFEMIEALRTRDSRRLREVTMRHVIRRLENGRQSVTAA